MPRPTSQDLAGYWDMLQLSVQDVSMKFDELHQLKLTDWKVVESPERKVSPCCIPTLSPPPPSLPPRAVKRTMTPLWQGVGAGLEGEAGTLWNLLYNKSLMGKPAVSSSLYPEVACL